MNIVPSKEQCSKRSTWVLQAIPVFCKANAINLAREVARLQEVPSSDIESSDLVKEYMRTAGESSVRPISYDEYLLHVLMANKRMILWDVLLSGGGLAEGGEYGFGPFKLQD
jgi:hypothetical protein